MRAVTFVAAFAALAAVASAVDYEAEFASFVGKYGKVYATPEERATRFAAFKRNFDWIADFQAGPKQTFTVRMNKFGDLMPAEFRERYLSPLRPNPSAKVTPFTPRAGDLPTNLDWRQHNAVTPVKDQGQCGSCWSFSVAQAIEGTYAIVNGTLTPLSEQQILDCSWGNPYNNTGCNGGDTRSAMQYVIDNKGLESEAEYKYIDINGGGKHKCEYNSALEVANITGMHGTIYGNETDLGYAAVAAPVSVAIDANHDSFQFYDYGIYYERKCGNNLNDLDHGVLVVGFAPDYWIVKNSWGTGWGMDGYIWMTRDSKSTKWPWKNNCGIASYATLALLD